MVKHTSVFIMKKYKTILLDPPWQYGRNGKYSAESNYNVMNIEEIYNLPINKLADQDCILFLWTTNGFLHEALHCIEKWGFEYKTTITWDKEHYGLGYWAWGQTEHFMIAVKGKPFRPHPPITRTIVRHKKGKHSAKPDKFYTIAEKMGEKPRLELFAREQSPLFPKREGWDVWGNEIQSEQEVSDILEKNMRTTDKSDYA